MCRICFLEKVPKLEKAIIITRARIETRRLTRNEENKEQRKTAQLARIWMLIKKKKVSKSNCHTSRHSSTIIRRKQLEAKVKAEEDMPNILSMEQ